VDREWPGLVIVGCNKSCSEMSCVQTQRQAGRIGEGGRRNREETVDGADGGVLAGQLINLSRAGEDAQKRRRSQSAGIWERRRRTNGGGGVGRRDVSREGCRSIGRGKRKRGIHASNTSVDSADRVKRGRAREGRREVKRGYTRTWQKGSLNNYDGTWNKPHLQMFLPRRFGSSMADMANKGALVHGTGLGPAV
jgi:hypothetical protein